MSQPHKIDLHGIGLTSAYSQDTVKQRLNEEKLVEICPRKLQITMNQERRIGPQTKRPMVTSFGPSSKKAWTQETPRTIRKKIVELKMNPTKKTSANSERLTYGGFRGQSLEEKYSRKNNDENIERGKHKKVFLLRFNVFSHFL